MSFPSVIWGDESDEMAQGTVQHLPLGTRMVFNDGRIFRYAQAGSSELAAHKIVGNATMDDIQTATYVIFSSTYAAGTTQVSFDGSATDATANDYADGWLIVGTTDVTYNQMVKIHSHDALTTSTEDGPTQYIYLRKPGLIKAVDTATCLPKLVKNPYRQVEILSEGPSTVLQAEIPLGVPPKIITGSNYFWLQTWGPALVLAGAGISSAADRCGLLAVMATGGTGAFCAPTTTIDKFATDSGITTMMPAIGVIMVSPPADNFYTMVNLTLAP